MTARLRALAHPLRLRILSLLTGTAMTAAEVARELGATHANASYHLRQLLAAGQIEVAAEEVIRGGRAKRYRYRPEAGRSDPAAVVRGPATRDHLTMYAVMAEELRRRSTDALRGPNNRLTDAELWVDAQTLADVAARIGQASLDLHAAARPPRTPGTRRVSASIALFEMGELDAGADR